MLAQYLESVQQQHLHITIHFPVGICSLLPQVKQEPKSNGECFGLRVRAWCEPGDDITVATFLNSFIQGQICLPIETYWFPKLPEAMWIRVFTFLTWHEAIRIFTVNKEFYGVCFVCQRLSLDL